MLSYVYYGTNDLPAAIVFYDAVLELAFWIGLPFDGRPAGPGNGSMVAFRAVEPAQVDAFHAAALAHGGVSEGEPGFRRHYGPDFYAAYVRDRDGNKLAAVCWSGW